MSSHGRALAVNKFSHLIEKTVRRLFVGMEAAKGLAMI